MKISPTLLLLPLLVAPLMQSQQEVRSFQLRLQDGKVWQGRVLGLSAEGLQVGLAAGKRELLHRELLDLQGPARLHVHGELPLLRLHSGIEIRARIVGGDKDGDSIQIRGPILGSRTLSIDAVAEILVPKKGRIADARQLVVSKEDQDKERLFRRAPLGLDLIKGFLFRISEKGAHFAPWHDEDKPQLYPWTDLAALVIPPPEEEAKPVEGVEWVLLTRDGSLWRGKPKGFSKDHWLLTTAIGELRIPSESIVSGHVQSAGSRTWLSDLAPAKVTEHGLVEGESQWKDLFGYRNRRNSVGGMLRVGGATWTQGIGAHSFSRIEFTVPKGRKRFMTQAGIDDSALRAEPSGNAAFRIFLDGKKVAEIPSLKGGQGVRTFPVLQVQEGQVLALELDFADHIYTGDRGNWLGAVFLP
jgi:NPCBM/NEW2 domain